MLNSLRLKLHVAVRNPETKKNLTYIVFGTAGISFIAYALGYFGVIYPISGVVLAVIVLFRSKPVVDKRLPINPYASKYSRKGKLQPVQSTTMPDKPRPVRFRDVFFGVVMDDLHRVFKRTEKATVDTEKENKEKYDRFLELAVGKK